ncbi:MAG: ABC transporter permease [Bacteroidia bacterium]|nr:ABC transporter permease [Bacteroidia bacterium]
MDFVNKDVGRGVAFVSKDEAAEKMIKDTGEDFKEFMGENPLKDAFMVNIDPTYHSKEQMEKIKKEIQAMTGVFEVSYIEGLIESINKNVTNIGLILVGLVCLLLLTVVLLINSTLRLALFSQRFLIRSMQLVGARSGFILRPFLVRSIGYGVLSGVLASAALFTATHYAGQAVADFSELYDQNKMIMLAGSLLVLGAFVALLSTFFSIRRYLRMSLDELY